MTQQVANGYPIYQNDGLTTTFREQIFQEEEALSQLVGQRLALVSSANRSTLLENDPEFTEYRQQMISALKENSSFFQSAPTKDEMRAFINKLFTTRNEFLNVSDIIRDALIDHYVTEVYGYGVIDDLMKDDYVSDIQCVGGIGIFYVKDGLVYMHDKTFASDDEMVAFFKSKLENTPFTFSQEDGRTDAFLPDGSRLHMKGVVSGFTVFDENGKGRLKPCNIVTIRKFIRNWTLEELIETGMLTPEMVDYIRICFDMNHSAIVSGSVGSGKTSIMNAMFGLFNPLMMACVIEDSPEMQPQHPRCVRLWEKKGNNEGGGWITVDMNVVDTLRMNFKYVVIGETRTPKVSFEFLKAIDNGNSVCITSTHASDGYGSVMRALFLAIADDSRPSEQMVRNQMRNLRLLVHCQKTKSGKRKVMKISELLGFDSESKPIIHDVFSYSRKKDEFIFNGVSRRFMEDVEEMDIELPDWMVEKTE